MARTPQEPSRARAFGRLHPDDQQSLRSDAMRPQPTTAIDLHVGMVSDLRRQHVDDVRAGALRARVWWLRFPLAALAVAPQWEWLSWMLLVIGTLYLPGQRLRALTVARRREAVAARLHVIDLTDGAQQSQRRQAG